MHKYRTADKIKISQIYHNYSISTKCFDGTTLYDMFLANQRAANARSKDLAGKKTAQSEEETQSSQNAKIAISGNKPMLEVAPYRPNKIVMDVQKYTEPTQAPEKEKEVYRRGCRSGNNFYTKIYDSLEIKKDELAPRIRIT